MSISADQNVLLIFLIISMVFLVISIELFIIILKLTGVFKYYIERKFDSIVAPNRNVLDKLNSYKKNQSQNKHNLKDIELLNTGIKLSNRIGGFFTHIFKK